MKYQAKEYAQSLYEALRVPEEKDPARVLDNFVKMLQDAGDLYLYPAIEKELEVLLRTEQGIKHVQVTTARDVAISQQLTEAIKSVVNSEVEILHKVDPRIVGGVVLRVDDVLVDGSIKTRLEDLRTALKR